MNIYTFDMLHVQRLVVLSGKAANNVIDIDSDEEYKETDDKE